MRKDDLYQLMNEFGFDPNDRDNRDIKLMCEEIERRTRTEFYQGIQAANNALTNDELDGREIEEAAYQNRRSRRKDSSPPEPAQESAL